MVVSSSPLKITQRTVYRDLISIKNESRRSPPSHITNRSTRTWCSGQPQRLAMPRGQPLPLRLRARAGALLLAATWLSSDPAGEVQRRSHLQREHASVKSCAPFCTISCVHQASIVEPDPRQPLAGAQQLLPSASRPVRAIRFTHSASPAGVVASARAWQQPGAHRSDDETRDSPAPKSEVIPIQSSFGCNEGKDWTLYPEHVQRISDLLPHAFKESSSRMVLNRRDT